MENPEAIQVSRREDGKIIAVGRGGITAIVIEDTCVIGGKRITTFQLCYPRFIHAEFMTHRAFSRNASSSRAIPVAKMIEQVRNKPAMPIHWGKNQPGMQAREEFDGNDRAMVIADWMAAADQAAIIAERMNRYSAHKQVVNRILEPFQFMNVIVTATEWDNFFELRDHEDAEPNIQELARVMRAAMNESKESKEIRMIPGAQYTFGSNTESEFFWHLPYITLEERRTYLMKILLSVSAARCARVSYLKHDGTNATIQEEIELFKKLVGSSPLHASPIEHQAKGLIRSDIQSGNFVGWAQFRQLYLPGAF